MAHNLEMRDGKASMMYVGERPWHELGVKLDNPATSEEAITACRANFTAVKVPLRGVWAKAKGGLIEVPGHYATMRTDTQQALGLVTDSYHIIQYAEAFRFFDSVVGKKLAIYHTAGVLGIGEKCWLLAKLPNDIHLSKHDVVEKFLALFTAHMGGYSLKMFLTPTRVVCQNTLSMAIAGIKRGEGISIPHVGDVQSKVEAARNTLGFANSFYSEFAKTAEKMIARRLTRKEIEQFINKLMPDGMMGKENLEKARQLVGHLAVHGKGQEGNTDIQDSAWAYYNGAVEYSDWHRKGMGGGALPSTKLASRWFGTAANFKMDAFKILGELCHIG